MAEGQNNSGAGEQPRVCPVCGTDIDPDSPAVKSTRRCILFAGALCPIGVVIAAAGKLIAYLTSFPAWGHGLVGFGIAVALLSALYYKTLD